jgi:hypothetical protein
MTRHILDAILAPFEWHQRRHERRYEAAEVRKRFRPTIDPPARVWVISERLLSDGMAVFVAASEPPGVEYVRRET